MSNGVTYTIKKIDPETWRLIRIISSSTDVTIEKLMHQALAEFVKVQRETLPELIRNLTENLRDTNNEKNSICKKD